MIIFIINFETEFMNEKCTLTTLETYSSAIFFNVHHLSTRDMPLNPPPWTWWKDNKTRRCFQKICIHKKMHVFFLINSLAHVRSLTGDSSVHFMHKMHQFSIHLEIFNSFHKSEFIKIPGICIYPLASPATKKSSNFLVCVLFRKPHVPLSSGAQ